MTNMTAIIAKNLGYKSVQIFLVWILQTLSYRITILCKINCLQLLSYKRVKIIKLWVSLECLQQATYKFPVHVLPLSELRNYKKLSLFWYLIKSLISSQGFTRGMHVFLFARENIQHEPDKKFLTLGMTYRLGAGLNLWLTIWTLWLMTFNFKFQLLIRHYSY